MEFRNEHEEIVQIVDGLAMITKADHSVYYQAWADGICLGSGSKEKALGHIDEYYKAQEEKTHIRERFRGG